MHPNILRQMGFHVGLTLPYGVHFRPNYKFLEKVATWTNPLLEMGAGTGFTVKAMQEYGKKANIGHMENCRGFDLHQREAYDIDMIHCMDALDFPHYHYNFTILVCRPDHSGWFEELYNKFESGEESCKRLVYVGLESNLDIDLPYNALDKISGAVKGVGEADEVMLWWEFSK